MELEDLVRALVNHDSLTARQWVVDARRNALVFRELASPRGLTPVELAVAAGIVELLAARAGQPPPDWTASVPASPEPVFLVKAAKTMPRLRRSCEEEAPEPLRRRGLLAPREFLTFA
jgi:hypothetical protein